MSIDTKILVSVFLILFFFISLMLAFNSFGARCAKAGYQAYHFQQCVKRLSNGGDVYLEPKNEN